MRIGNVLLENNVILAPMAGVTDRTFRIIVKGIGCGLVYTEMISDKGLIYKNDKTHRMLEIDDRERPAAVQLFGAEPGTVAEAAKIVEAAGADMIDINMGCPAPKVVKNHEGSALLRTPDKAYKLLAEVVRAVKLPVTVKIRKGWDDESVNAVDIAALAEAAGVAAIAVHGRTRQQYYAGRADWQIIAAVKARVAIPVIGNGDVRTPEDAARMLAETGCDAVMVGRAVEGNPWLPRQISHYLSTGTKLPEPTVAERFQMIDRHLAMLIADKGEYIACREMRHHAAWYTKGLPRAAEYRLRFNNAQTSNDFAAIAAAFRHELQEGGLEW